MTSHASAKPRVVIADPIHEDGVRMLAERFDVLAFKPSERQACTAAVREADAVVVRTFVVDAPLMAQAPRLRAICKHGAGVDNIDIPAATARGIMVANSGDANAQSVAEATVSLMLAALRKTPQMHRAMTEGRYDVRWGLLLEGICGKTLGVVGFGNIGRRVARMCRHGFDMNVLVFDPFLSAEEVAAQGATAVSLEHLLQAADVVSLNAGMKHGARPLIDAPALALMKPSAVIVNTARGGLIDEDALADALRCGRLYGAGLDVLAQEPPAPDHPLFALDNVVLSPHVGGATSSARRLMATRAAEAVIAILSGQPPEFGLNPAAQRSGQAASVA